MRLLACGSHILLDDGPERSRRFKHLLGFVKPAACLGAILLYTCLDLGLENGPITMNAGSDHVLRVGAAAASHAAEIALALRRIETRGDNIGTARAFAGTGFEPALRCLDALGGMASELGVGVFRPSDRGRVADWRYAPNSRQPQTVDPAGEQMEGAAKRSVSLRC